MIHSWQAKWNIRRMRHSRDLQAILVNFSSLLHTGNLYWKRCKIKGELPINKLVRRDFGGAPRFLYSPEPSELWRYDHGRRVAMNADRGRYPMVEGGGGGMGMGMMNMEMPHPMHIHGVQFQVLGRQIMRGYQSAYQELSAGFVDDGWKDTVLVMPGEKVQVLVRFEDYAGTFVYHCHNLEHGDAGMMRNYKIES